MANSSFRKDDSGIEDLDMSVKAKRPRNSWFIYVTKCDTYDLALGYKTGKGVIREYSCSKSNSPVKIPFGTPLNWQFHKKTEKGVTSRTMHFRSKRGGFKFENLELINMFLKGI